MKKITIQDIQNLKNQGSPFATITAYDYLSAQIVDEANIPLILVGDSLLSKTSEVINESTSPFVGIFSTYGLIKAISD